MNSNASNEKIARRIAKLGAATRCGYDRAAEKLAYQYTGELFAIPASEIATTEFGTLRQKAEAFRLEWLDQIARSAHQAGAYNIRTDLDILITIATQTAKTEIIRLKLSDKLIAIREAQSARDIASKL